MFTQALGPKLQYTGFGCPRPSKLTETSQSGLATSSKVGNTVLWIPVRAKMAYVTKIMASTDVSSDPLLHKISQLA